MPPQPTVPLGKGRGSKQRTHPVLCVCSICGREPTRLPVSPSFLPRIQSHSFQPCLSVGCGLLVDPGMWLQLETCPYTAGMECPRCSPMGHWVTQAGSELAGQDVVLQQHRDPSEVMRGITESEMNTCSCYGAVMISSQCRHRCINV